MLLIAWYFATNRKWKDISWEIRRGLKCPSCKENIYTKEEENQLWMNGRLPVEGDNITSCKSCRRDESIDVLFGKRSSLFLGFRNYLISDKSRKLLLYMLVALFSFTIIDIICSLVFNIRGLSIVSNSFNLLYWVVMFIKRRYSSIRN